MLQNKRRNVNFASFFELIVKIIKFKGLFN